MEKILQKLLNAGYKLTKPRVTVIKSLCDSRKPISARLLCEKNKKIDRASVYRVLNLLADRGFINVETFDKEKLYCLAGKPHHHIICQKCGYAEEIECRHNFGNFKNFKNVRHNLVLTGLCLKCA